jgi:hypothetical protein
MSACEEENTTSARFALVTVSLTMTCSALTVMSPLPPLTELVCSLMMTWAVPIRTAWFGAPVTRIVVPSMTRSVTMELPLTEAAPLVHFAVAFEVSTVAVTVWPAAVRFANATEAADWL